MQAVKKITIKIYFAGVIMALLSSCALHEKNTNLSCKATCKNCDEFTLECRGVSDTDKKIITGAS